MEFTVMPSPLGAITLAAEGARLVGLWLEGQKYFGSALTGDAVRRDDAPALAAARAWLSDYFAGARPDPAALALAPRGTEFQRRVWAALQKIPYGRTTTYGALAAALGGTSARAVGAAVGRNPISIVIPCHRVLGADGGLTGYAGGVARKRFLLALERGENPAAQ